MAARKRHLRGHDGPAEISAAHRHDQPGGNDDLPHDPISLTISPAIDGLRISASYAARHNAQRQQGDQQIHREGRQHRQQRRAANVALVSRPRGHDYRPLHADKHPQGDQHGVFDLFPYRHAQRQAAKIEAERIQLKGQGGERDKGAQRQKLGEGGHQG